jgi:2-(1,2-epoxy-1,2-dihydrophenyl)acetyl-CoA isomerase
MTYETILYEAADGVARITLNRPDSLNGWNAQIGIDLLDAVQTAGSDDEVRALAVTGAGRAFSSGADLSEPPELTPEGRPDLRKHLETRYNPLILAVREIPKPVVAIVNGPAAGIGCSFALACDLVIAASSAYFLLAFARIGLTIDGGASAFLAKRIGYGRAAELAMLAERLPAETALEWGLINRVVAVEELEAAAEELTARLAAGATRSFAATKRMLNARLYPDLEQALALEAELQQEMAETDDFPEGATAFLQKRPPAFKGR